MFGSSTNITILTEGTLNIDGTGTVHPTERLARTILGDDLETVRGSDYEVNWKISDGTLTMTPKEGCKQPELEYLLQESSAIRRAISGVGGSSVGLSDYEVKRISGLVINNTTAAKQKNLGTQGSLGALTWTVE